MLIRILGTLLPVFFSLSLLFPTTTFLGLVLVIVSCSTAALVAHLFYKQSTSGGSSLPPRVKITMYTHFLFSVYVFAISGLRHFVLTTRPSYLLMIFRFLFGFFVSLGSIWILIRDQKGLNAPSRKIIASSTTSIVLFGFGVFLGDVLLSVFEIGLSLFAGTMGLEFVVRFVVWVIRGFVVGSVFHVSRAVLLVWDLGVRLGIVRRRRGGKEEEEEEEEAAEGGAHKRYEVCLDEGTLQSRDAWTKRREVWKWAIREVVLMAGRKYQKKINRATDSTLTKLVTWLRIYFWLAIEVLLRTCEIMMFIPPDDLFDEYVTEPLKVLQKKRRIMEPIEESLRVEDVVEEEEGEGEVGFVATEDPDGNDDLDDVEQKKSHCPDEDEGSVD